MRTAARLDRLERANRCPTCGYSQHELRERLREMIAMVRRELLSKSADRIVEGMRLIWTRP